MADMRRQLFAHIWEEEECLEYYGMISLHHMFEVIGSQLTENDVEVLSFLLDETQPWTHPLDPIASPLFLELERRGKCDETNFLLQLLRVLTRHDLLPYVTLKRQRTVSPERYTYGPSVLSADQQVDNCLNSASSEPRHDQWETGSNSSKRKRVSRGRSKATPCRRRGAKAASAPKQEVPAPTKVTCGRCLPSMCCVPGVHLIWIFFFFGKPMKPL
uniref:DED domain-containing protein n=1 Tax=Ailuropoda melanoleuca TaxID=9646 RepID=A0A7N5JSK5_AILME